MLRNLLIFWALVSIALSGSLEKRNAQAQPKAANGNAQQVVPSSTQPGVDSRQSLQADVKVIQIPSKDLYDRISFWINASLAVVGISGIVVGICTLSFLREQVVEMRLQRETMVRQLNAIERQAAIMETQIALQETLNQQWIDISGWRREGEGSREQVPPTFQIAAEITNPSPLPIFVNRITLGIGDSNPVHGDGNTLGPGRSIKISHPVTVENKNDLAQHRSHALVLTVAGTVEYTDAFETRREQPFRCTGVFGPNRYAVFYAAS